MRYILNSEGYIYDVSFGAEIECSLGTCTEYKGDIPEDYETIEEWFSGESERLNAWKIVDGNLVFDASRDYKLKIIYEQEANENTHVTRKEMGMASTEEVNPYADLYPSQETGSSNIVSATEKYGKVGNLPTEEIKLTVNEDQDIEFVEIEFIGSNFLPNTAISSINNGIEYTPNIDKTIKISGTATDRSTLNLAGTETSIKKILTFKEGMLVGSESGNYIEPHKYTLYGLHEGISLEFYHYDGTDRTLIGVYKDNDVITFDKDTNVTQVVLVVESGTTIDTTIKPMLALIGIEYPVLPMTKYKGNLLNPVGASDSYNGLTFTNEGNGVFSISGTATKASGFALTNLSTYPIILEKGKYYTQKVFMLEGDLNFSITTAIKKEDGTNQYNFFVNNHTRQIEFDTNITVYNAYIAEGSTVNARFKVMLQEGQSIGDYEEYNNKNDWYYVDGVSTQATRSGKNKLLHDYYDGTSKTINGITYTVNDDGSVTANGTATANASFNLTSSEFDIPAGTYKLVGENENYSSVAIRGAYKTSDGTTKYLGSNSGSFVIDEASYGFNFYIVILSGVSVENITFYPMLLLEDETDLTFERGGISPSPDYPSEIINLYSAGTYNTLLNGKVFEFEIPEDLRSVPSGVADRLWFNMEGTSPIEIEKKVGNVILNGSESSWLENSVTKGLFQITLENITTDMTKVNAMSNYFKGSSATDIVNTWYTNNSVSTYTSNRLFFRSDDYANNLDGFKTLLSTNNVEVYYELETPTTSEISSYSHSIATEYEEYKNNKALVDLKGNEFTIYDIVHIRDNQIIFAKNGAMGVDIEEIYLGDISMPRTYTPMTYAYCHQPVNIQFKYRDVRNIDITKISLKGLLSITDIETEYNYTLEDIDKVIAYVNGETTLTDEELEYYDVNADGVVDKVDSAEMLRMYHGYISNIVNGTLEINSTKANRTIVLRDSEGKIKTSLGLNGICTPSLSVNGVLIEEKIINSETPTTTFLDGKRVYKKLYTGTMPSTVESAVNLFDIDFDFSQVWIDESNSFISNEGETIGINWYYSTEDYLRTLINKTNKQVKFRCGKSLSSFTYNIVLAYTKSEEDSGSGEEEETEPSIENIVEVNKTSTISGTTNSNVWTFKSVVTEKSIDKTNKTSIVTITNYIGRPSSSGSSYFMGTLTNKYKCGDQTYSETVYKSSGTINAGSWYKLGSKTFTIEHTEEPMTINVGGSMSTSAFNPSSASASGTITLTEINEEVE